MNYPIRSLIYTPMYHMAPLIILLHSWPVCNTKPNPVKARPLADVRCFLPSTLLVPARVFIFDLAMLIRPSQYRLGLQYTRSLSTPDPYRRMSGLPFGGKLGISPGPDFFRILFLLSPRLYVASIYCFHVFDPFRPFPFNILILHSLLHLFIRLIS